VGVELEKQINKNKKYKKIQSDFRNKNIFMALVNKKIL